MEPLDRRSFIVSTGAAGAALAAGAPVGAGPQTNRAVFIATWQWGILANARAAEVLGPGGSLMDAVEKGINAIEDDANVDSVGYGGLQLTQDQKPDLRRPSSDGENAAHHDGWRRGAAVRDFDGIPAMQLLTPKSLEAWLKWKKLPNRKTFWIDKDHHDTIGMLATDGDGHVVAGCSTSGLAWKIPGRVADSLLVGCGYLGVHRWAYGGGGTSPRRLRSADGIYGKECARRGPRRVLRDRAQLGR